MASSEAVFGGSLGGHFRLHLDVNEVSVDNANNRSLIDIVLYMYSDSSSTGAFNLFNPPSADAPGGNTDVSGIGVAGFNHTYDFRGNSGPLTLVNHRQEWIGHNSNGQGSVSVNGFFDAKNSPYLTTASTGLTLGLTNIPRFANITSFTVTNVHDEGFNINVTADATCDLLQYSIDNGVSWTQVAGDFTSKTVQLHDIPSGATYNVRVSVRRKDSGLSTQAGPTGVSTPQQGQWLAFMF